VIARPEKVTFTLAFHTETAIPAKLAGDGQTMRAAFDSATLHFIGTRKPKSRNHIQLGFDRNLSTAFLVAQSTVLVERIVTHS